MSALGQKQTFRDSLDQVVGALLEVKRNVESERLGGLEIDDQLILGRSLHWEMRRLSTVEDAVNVIGCLAKLFDEIGTIRDQPARLCINAIVIDRWDAVAGGQRNDRFPICRVECARHHDEAASRIACLFGDNALDLILSVNRSNSHFDGKG